MLNIIPGISLECVPAGIAQSVEHRALSHKIMGLNLPVVPEVTLGDHSSSSFTTPRCKIGTRPWPGQSELTPRIHYVQVTGGAGNGASTLALKPMGGVNRSLKQRVPVAPQKIFEKKVWKIVTIL